MNRRYNLDCLRAKNSSNVKINLISKRPKRKRTSLPKASFSTISINDSWIEADGSILQHELNDISCSQTIIEWESSEDENTGTTCIETKNRNSKKLQPSNQSIYKTPLKTIPAAQSNSPIIRSSRPNFRTKKISAKTKIDKGDLNYQIESTDIETKPSDSFKYTKENEHNISLPASPILGTKRKSHNNISLLSSQTDIFTEDSSINIFLPETSSSIVNKKILHATGTSTLCTKQSFLNDSQNNIQDKSVSIDNVINGATTIAYENLYSNSNNDKKKIISETSLNDSQSPNLHNSDNSQCKIYDSTSLDDTECDIENYSLSSSSTRISLSSPILTKRNDRSFKSTGICELESKKPIPKMTGSDWIKALKEKTPEKPGILNDADLTLCNSPNSKKIKKDGFSEHLQKLFQSWKSNLNMWNHQMNLTWTQKCLSCSMSPTIDAKFPPIFRRSKSVMKSPHMTKIKSGVNAKIDVKSPRTPNILTVKQKFCRSGIISRNGYQTPTNSSKQMTRKDSFDISPSSSYSLSNSSNKTERNQKHICLRILEVLKPLSSYGSYFKCVEIDYCYRNQNLTDSEISNKSENPQLQNYFVVLGQISDNDKVNTKLIKVGDEIKIYAPWQLLNLGSGNISTILSSYYTVRSSAKEELNTDEKKSKIKVTLAVWSCSCTKEGHIMPSTCTGGSLNLCDNETRLQNNLVDIGSKVKFDIIQDHKRLKDKEPNRIWTVLAAIEQCGGLPGIHISITTRILRIFQFKKPKSENDKEMITSCYTILGQDPSGIFFIVEIPNCPLISSLSELLDSTGTTQTLTHLTVAQRLIDTHHPDLFSMIHTLHQAYETAIREDQRLCNLMPRGNILPQTFCYKFSVTLGMTEHILIAKTEGINLPQIEFSLENNSLNERRQRRGILIVNIFYYVHPYLYVNSLQATEKNLKKIFVRDSNQFPSWMHCSGTIMAVVKIKDIWESKSDCFCIDKFTSFERCSEKLLVSYEDTLKLIPNLSSNDQLVNSDLVVLSGGLIKCVHEDDSLSWKECPHCKSSSLRYNEESDLFTCTNCDSKNVLPINKFSLKVSVMTEYNFIVIVKLFQRTIEKLLRKCYNNSSQTYNSGALLGMKLDSAICFVQTIAERNEGTVIQCLREMPY